MSLAVLADHMASKGRGPDSMLIHMSPREVQGLQALAMAHGGSLTVNPDTGLPEAGFLDKLLPTILGAGLTFMGVPPNVSAMIVGGIQTVRTGDLGKGIQAGLGAYGGANLTSSMTAAGGSAIGSEAAGQSYLSNYAPPGVLEGAGAGLSADMAYNLADAGVSTLGEGAAAANQAATSAVEAASPYEKLSRGFGSATDQLKSSPMQYLKDNAKNLGYAFGPAILAEMNVKQNMPQTTTKPGMITPYSFFGGQYVPGQAYQASPTRAANGGLMGLAAGGMAGYGDGDDVPRRTIDGMAQGGMYDFAQRSEPVVRMADGGVPGYAIGGPLAGNLEQTFAAAQKSGDYSKLNDLLQTNRVSEADIKNQWKDIDTSALAGLGVKTYSQTNPDGTINFDAFNPKNYVNSVTKVNTQAEVDAANAANPYSAQNMAKVDVTRPGQYVTDPTTGNPVALTAGVAGFNANNPTALTYLGELASKGGQDSTSQAFNQIATPAQKAEADRLWTAEKARLTALDVAAGRLSAGNQGLVGLNQNQNLLTNQNQNTNLTNANAGLPGLIPAGASDTYKWFAERGLGFSQIDKSIDNWFDQFTDDLALLTPQQQEKAMRDALQTERMNEADLVKATGKTIAQWIQQKAETRKDGSTIVPGKLDEVPADSLPGGVSGAGNTVVNANGTITTKPDFSLGMGDVRDMYTEGGGSLGYIPYAPQTIEEFNTKYVNPLKGGTKQSYNYLTGKEKYDPIPYTEDGQIAKSYAESVMKLPRASSSKMYIFKNGKFEPNPDYAIPTYDSKGVKSSNLTNADVKAYMDKKPSATDFYTWATTNNLSPEQIAIASGRPINEISKLYTGAKALTGEDGNIDQTKVDEKTAADEKANFDATAYLKANPDVQAELDAGKANFGDKSDLAAAAWEHYQRYGKMQNRPYTKKAAAGGLMAMARGGMAQQFNLGDYSDGGRLLRGPGDGVSDSIPATIGNKRPARLADGEFVVPARIVSELGNGSTEAGARKLYAMMDRVQAARRGSIGKGKVAKNSRADKYLPA